MRRERLAVQHAELRGNFLIAAHCIRHAGAGVRAGEGGASQGEKYRERLHQHERLADRITAKRPGAHQHHHVADGSAGKAPALDIT